MTIETSAQPRAARPKAASARRPVHVPSSRTARPPLVRLAVGRGVDGHDVAVRARASESNRRRRGPTSSPRRRRRAPSRSGTRPRWRGPHRAPHQRPAAADRLHRRADCREADPRLPRRVAARTARPSRERASHALVDAALGADPARRVSTKAAWAVDAAASLSGSFPVSTAWRSAANVSSTSGDSSSTISYDGESRASTGRSLHDPPPGATPGGATVLIVSLGALTRSRHLVLLELAVAALPFYK